MTIIQTSGVTWIESFNIPRTNLAGGGLVIVPITLARTGKFRAVSATLDNISNTDGFICVRNTDNSEITLNQSISDFEVIIANNAVGAGDLGAHIILYMSK